MANKKQTVQEPVLTVDEEVVLADWRHQQALNREAEAVVAELQKRQYQKYAVANPEAPGIENQKIQLETRSDQVAATAAAMRSLAGTTQLEAKENVLRTLESQRFSYQQQYIGAQDAVENPEAYATGSLDPLLWACGLEALDELIAEVQDWGPAQPQGKAKGGK